MKLDDFVITGFKPCPFCASKDIEAFRHGERIANTWRIKCFACGANKFVVTRFRKQLRAEWNRRA